MKRLPEKLMMAAIILSCGFVAHLDPVPGNAKQKRTPAASLHKQQLPPVYIVAAAPPPARLARHFPAPAVAP